MPLVSVIIPTYNRANLLKEAIYSVMNQTFNDWELLVVDDRSTDNTRELVSSLSSKDPRIKYLTNQFKKGPAGARQYGVNHAKGKYIAFLDSDDLWKPWHLKNGINILEKNKDISWFYADVEVRDINGVLLVSSVKREKWLGRKFFQTDFREEFGNFYVFNDKNFLFKALKYELYAGLQTSIIRKKLFDSLQFNTDIKIGEDKLLVYQAILLGVKFGYLLSIHATYRIHDNHISNVKENNSLLKIAKSLDYAKLFLTLLELMPNEKKRERMIILEKLAHLYFWDVGYIYFSLGYKEKAFYYYKKALKLYPYSYKFWKTFLICSLKRILKKGF